MRQWLTTLIIGLTISGAAYEACAAELRLPKDLEPRFRDGLKNCERFDGMTNEPACDGAGVEVFVLGDEPRLLRWGLGKSRFYISHDYYLAKGRLVFVVERVRKYSGTDIVDGVPETDWHSKQVLFRRIRPGRSSHLASASGSGPKEESWPEMEKHVTELIARFQSKRGDFERVGSR